MCISLDSLDIILKKLQDDNLIQLYEHKEDNFDRVRKFIIDKKGYTIIWYKNLCTLIIDNNIEVKFNYLTVNGLYPNSTDLNFNFKYDDNTICIIPIK